MRGKNDNDVEEISLDMFNDCLEKLWRKKGNKYQFLMKAGYDLKNALFCILNSVWKSEEIPTSWKKTNLIQLSKGKKDFTDLSGMRYIHIKQDTQKVFSNIVIQQVQNLLSSNMSIFQIGTKKGHRASEHIYVLKTIMKKYEYLNKPIIINLWDFSVFFDSESLIDVLAEAHKCHLRGKIYRLL